MRRRKTDDVSDDACTIRVLAVDDDAAYLKYLDLVLTRAGFEVTTASGGQAAIERMKDDRSIDLMLVDLVMPGMDGIETVRRVQQDIERPGVYAVLLTSRDGTDTKVRALESGLDDYITKATPESELVARLRSAARRIDIERTLQMKNEQLRELALTDELTGLSNRRALFCAGKLLIANHATAAAILFDLDGFKQINDTYGHRTGDHLLAGVARTFLAATRVGDLVARLGGDEFVLLLPDRTASDGHAIAARTAESASNARWHDGQELQVLMSYGVACSPADGADLDSLLERCDERLYAAKGVLRERAGLRSPRRDKLTPSVARAMRNESNLRTARP